MSIKNEYAIIDNRTYMAKSKEKLEARELRKKGQSIKEIAKLLNVSVGSVSVWCNDITLTSKQIKTLEQRRIDPNYGSRMKYVEKRKREFNKKVEEIKQSAINELGKLTEREIFLMGITLYWGEGFKKDHLVGLASSDKDIAKFFIYWLEKCFNISPDNLILRVTANISYKSQINKLEEYWSKKLNIPLNNFSKPYFQHSAWKKEYENKENYHGVIRIKVRKSINLLRKIFGYIEGVSSQLP